jgi:hypothetical protein
MAWINKGPHPVHLAKARGFFARALAIEPDNVDALIGRRQGLLTIRPVSFSDPSISADIRPGR